MERSSERPMTRTTVGEQAGSGQLFRRDGYGFDEHAHGWMHDGRGHR